MTEFNEQYFDNTITETIVFLSMSLNILEMVLRECMTEESAKVPRVKTLGTLAVKIITRFALLLPI